MNELNITLYFVIQLIIMALVTYLIRTLPLTLFRRKIENRFFKSFLYYVPYAVLGAMTFPAVIYCGGSIITGIAGTTVALILAFCGRGLLTVALVSSITVFITNLILSFI